MIRVARYNMYTDKTMAWGDDRDLNLVVNVGSHVYTVYNKTAEVDHESEDALCWWWDNMARMLRRGPSNEDLERFAAHYKLEVVERPDSLSRATLPSHNVGWALDTFGWNFRYRGTSCFTWMMEEVETEFLKGTSAEDLFATLTANVKSVDCSERLVQVDIPLKPLLELVEVAHARGQHNECIARALGALVLPPEHKWYFMGSPAVRMQSHNEHSDVWDMFYCLHDACPALPVVTRKMLVDAKMRLRTRATIAIQKQWHKSICDPSYTMCKRRLMREFEAMMREFEAMHE